MTKIIVSLVLLVVSVYASNFKNSVGMKFVKIPDGSFMMGRKKKECKDDPFTAKNEYKECIKEVKELEKDETPYHKVKIRSFYMQTTEVTQLQYYKVMGKNPSYFKQERLGYNSKNNPVENVSWYDAIEFVKKLNALEHTNKYYLPTEEEWEYVAKAKSTREWFFGSDISKLKKYAWYGENSGFKTHPVAKKKPNRWGVYDIYGNVGEWTSSGYSEDYNSPRDINYKVIRGGSWNTNAHYSNAISRLYSEPDYFHGYYGFRVAKRK